MLVDDLDRTVAFYTDVLGFEVAQAVPARAPHRWVLLRRGATELFFQTRANMGPLLRAPSPPAPSPRLTLVLDVDDAEALHRQVAGQTPVVVPLCIDGAGRPSFAVCDCNGFVLVFCQSADREAAPPDVQNQAA